MCPNIDTQHLSLAASQRRVIGSLTSDLEPEPHTKQASLRFCGDEKQS